MVITYPHYKQLQGHITLQMVICLMLIMHTKLHCNPLQILYSRNFLTQTNQSSNYRVTPKCLGYKYIISMEKYLYRHAGNRCGVFLLTDKKAIQISTYKPVVQDKIMHSSEGDSYSALIHI